jgi:putative flippase GtrA
MNRRAAALLELARSDAGQKWVRYSATSMIAVVVGQGLLAFFYSGLDWSARAANVAAVCISSGPSYLLNRYWAWGKRGRNHLLKEVAPFWAMALLGLAVSTWAVGYAEDHWDFPLAVNLANLGSYGVLWVGKFVVLNELLFKHHPEQLAEVPALDGRSGIPT